MKNKIEKIKIFLIILVTIILILLAENFILKGGKIQNKKQIIKEMTQSENEANLQTQINTLNTSHNEYATKVQNYKKQIADVITSKGVTTLETATAEEMAENIEKIATNKYKDGYNKGYENGYQEGYDEINIENLNWQYVEISGTPSANSSSMSWDITSIPNYQKLEINKTLNPVMISTFDMNNWTTSQSRAWKITWTYNASIGRLSISTIGGPSVQYGTALVSRKIGIYYLNF